MRNYSFDAKRWLEYYLKSIRDGDRINISEADGSVSADPDSTAFSKEITTLFQNNTGEQIEETETIDVEIAPFSFAERAKDGRSSGKRWMPFWIPAVLFRDGTFSPPKSGSSSYPWFLREALESPIATKLEVPTCGLLDDYDHAITETDFESIETWDEYWRIAEHVFERVTGSTFETFSADSYAGTTTFEKTSLWTIRTPDIKGASRHVEELYAAYTGEDAPVPSLVRQMLQTDGSHEDLAVFTPFEQLLDPDHLGQMDNEHPLSPSQRISMSAFLRTGAGDILAINGPPGTGKTTLLRHIVANEFVRAAMAPENEKKPAKILASSTNNQAITNILENFGKITSDHPLSRRWIPVSPSFGIYLASKTAGEKWEERETGVPWIYKVASGNDKPEVGKEYPGIEGIDPEAQEDVYLNNARLELQGIADESQLSSIVGVTRYLEDQLHQWYDVLKNVIGVTERFASEFTAVSQRGVTIETLVCDVAAKLKTKVDETRERVELWDRARSALKKYVSGEPFWLQLFDWLPIVRKRRMARLQTRFSHEYSAIEMDTIGSVAALEKHLDVVLKEAQHAADSAREHSATFQSEKKWMDKVIRLAEQEGKCGSIVVSEGTDASQPWATALSELLDITVRYRMFNLAARFWEGEWIKTVRERIGGEYPELTGGEKGRRRLLDEIACLTPLLVSTCQSVSRFFKVTVSENGGFRDGYLSAECDLVIMDEAGQVSPEVGLAPFFFGKRGLVVGDVFQIEPVWNIYSSQIDIQNLQITGVLKDESDASHDEQYQKLTAAGVLSSNGSIMQMAQQASRFGRNESPPGIMLTEHRRCVDEVIRFCNENVYGGRLEPKAGSIDDAKTKGTAVEELPAMGYAHINGRSEKRGGSRQNVAEARAVALFLKSMRERLIEAFPDERLEDIVGIVTPFRAQTELIKTELNKELGDAAGNLTVGTVHSLQGAERPVILFSPTYGRNDLGTRFFFDQSVNMLNVAVSRAKRHFLVIGDARIFDRRNSEDPSARLGRIILSDPENEVSTGFFYSSEAPRDSITGEKWPVNNLAVMTDRISTLKKHREALRRAIDAAHTRIVLVSPFISHDAVKSDDIPQLIKAAKERNVDVIVFTDDRLDVRHGTVRESSRAGRAVLVEAGAELKVCSGIHNKSIAVDNRILIEGSFNWFSASRNPNSAFARHEVSIIMWDQDDDSLGPQPDSSSKMDDRELSKRLSSVAKNIDSLIKELDERPCGSFGRAADS